MASSTSDLEKLPLGVQDEQIGTDSSAFEGSPEYPSPEKLTHTTSHISAISSAPSLPHVPPDGGLHAWLKVLGGFLIYSNIWGFTLSFGAFQTYYQHVLLPTSSASAISWIGTVQSYLLILVGVIAGPMFDKGYFRSMLFAGNFLVVFGIMMLSLCTTYWQVFLAQGVCMGLGAGLLYIPSLALVGIYFSRKRSLAMGIVTSGIAVGGIAYIITFDRLTAKKGFPFALRIMGCIALAISLASFPALLSGTSILKVPRKARKLFDASAWRDPLFLVFTASSFCCFLGYITPYFFIPTYAQDHLGLSQSFALYILVMAIGGSFFGRLISGWLAHHLGANFTWIICSMLAGMLSLVWMAVDSEASFIAWSIIWGLFSAGLVTLPGSCFPNVCPDLSLLGTRLGMSWGVSSISTLIGAPIAGALLTGKKVDGKVKTDFVGVQLWSGICLLVGAGVLIVLHTMTRRIQKKGFFI
jgi:MFS family permease